MHRNNVYGRAHSGDRAPNDDGKRGNGDNLNQLTYAEEIKIRRDNLHQQLVSMGVAAPYARVAVENVDPALPDALALCFHWMDENPQEQVVEKGVTRGGPHDLNARPDSPPPSEVEQKEQGQPFSVRQLAVVNGLQAMGFDRGDAILAVRRGCRSIEDAVAFVVSFDDVQDEDSAESSSEDEQLEEQLQQDDVANAGKHISPDRSPVLPPAVPAQQQPEEPPLVLSPSSNQKPFPVVPAKRGSSDDVPPELPPLPDMASDAPLVPEAPASPECAPTDSDHELDDDRAQPLLVDADDARNHAVFDYRHAAGGVPARGHRSSSSADLRYVVPAVARVEAPVPVAAGPGIRSAPSSPFSQLPMPSHQSFVRQMARRQRQLQDDQARTRLEEFLLEHYQPGDEDPEDVLQRVIAMSAQEQQEKVKWEQVQRAHSRAVDAEVQLQELRQQYRRQTALIDSHEVDMSPPRRRRGKKNKGQLQSERDRRDFAAGQLLQSMDAPPDVRFSPTSGVARVRPSRKRRPVKVDPHYRHQRPTSSPASSPMVAAAVEAVAAAAVQEVLRQEEQRLRLQERRRQRQELREKHLRMLERGARAGRKLSVLEMVQEERRLSALDIHSSSSSSGGAGSKGSSTDDDYYHVPQPRRRDSRQPGLRAATARRYGQHLAGSQSLTDLYAPLQLGPLSSGDEAHGLSDVGGQYGGPRSRPTSPNIQELVDGNVRRSASLSALRLLQRRSHQEQLLQPGGPVDEEDADADDLPLELLMRRSRSIPAAVPEHKRAERSRPRVPRAPRSTSHASIMLRPSAVAAAKQQHLQAPMDKPHTLPKAMSRHFTSRTIGT